MFVISYLFRDIVNPLHIKNINTKSTFFITQGNQTILCTMSDIKVCHSKVKFENSITAFPLISTSGAYLILEL